MKTIWYLNVEKNTSTILGRKMFTLLHTQLCILNYTIMKTLLKKINIEKIEFQSNVNEVSIQCSIKINELSYQNELIINYSQLNKLLGKIQQVTQWIDIYSFFRETQINDNSTLYTMEGAEIELDSIDFEEIVSFSNAKKISA